MTKSINKTAPVICNKSISIDAYPERVWDVLTNINKWAKWQVDITNVKLNEGLSVNSSFKWKSGGLKINSTIHTMEPFHSFGWTGKTLGVFAIHNWKLVDSNNVTMVYVSESMEGILATIFKKQFNKTLEKGMRNWLNLLKKECEK